MGRKSNDVLSDKDKESVKIAGRMSLKSKQSLQKNKDKS